MRSSRDSIPFSLPFARRLPVLLISLAFAGLCQADDKLPGLDTAGFNTAARPQDSLFNAYNGNWVKNTEIPGDKSRWGSFSVLAELSDQRLRTIVDEFQAKPQKPGTSAAMLSDFYKAFIDTDALDRQGLGPIKPELDALAALKDVKQLSSWMGRAQGVWGTPLSLQVEVDFKQPGRYTVLTSQSGLGLPNRDYYLKDDERMAKARAAYEVYLSTLGTLSGDAQAAETAKMVMALERRIAEAHWAQVEMRDPVKIYNPKTVDKIAADAPGIDWPVFLSAAGLTQVDRISDTQPSATQGIAKLLAEVPLAQWKAYQRLHMLDEAAAVLPKAYRDARFAFRGVALSGSPQPRARWQQGIDEINEAMGEALGEVYVQRYFPPAAKARMQKLVDNLLATYQESIAGVSWMTPDTKAAAQAKLAKYTTKIGYPDQFRRYDGLVVKAGDALGNRMRAGRFEWLRNARRAGGPVDRKEWGISPQTINAYYNPVYNEIVFPAAILQPPFFEMAADDAVNYGAIGAGIGHEISHGFDDEGSQFDGDGALRNWWSEADRKAFEAVAEKLAAQYDGYEALPGKKLNGHLTLGENIADLSGLQIAFKAYKRSLGGKPSPVINGTTGEQRFFMAWAQIWREKTREERQLQLLVVDPHSPARFRTDGAAVNHDGFHETFGTKPGDAMYKPSEERIRIW